MTANEIKALKLTAKMVTALTCTEPGDLMKGGPTRAALIRRGLVCKMSRLNGMAGRFTPDGLKVRAALLEQGQ